MLSACYREEAKSLFFSMGLKTVDLCYDERETTYWSQTMNSLPKQNPTCFWRTTAEMTYTTITITPCHVALDLSNSYKQHFAFVS